MRQKRREWAEIKTVSTCRDISKRERQGMEMREREDMDYKNMGDKSVDYRDMDERNAEYGDVEERLLAGREDYRRIPVPEQMRAKLEEGIRRAEAERERESEAGGFAEAVKKDRKRGEDGNMGRKKIVRFRIAAAVAAAAVILVVLPNTGANIAHAMGTLPVVGRLFQAVTFRDYQYESERFDAKVEVPQIQVDDLAGEEADAQAGQGADAQTGESAEINQSAGENTDKLQQTVEQINFDIEKVTNQLIEEFQESADLGESYGSLKIEHETVTNNDRYFTLKLLIYQGAGSGSVSYKLYTIDKATGEQIQIGDLFKEGSDYRELLSEDIRDQMRAKMAEDDYNFYWVDDEEMPALNWEGLKEDQNFYLDEAGNLVIVFDEYEVAPGYMGAQEFTVDRSVFENILKER